MSDKDTQTVAVVPAPKKKYAAAVPCERARAHACKIRETAYKFTVCMPPNNGPVLATCSQFRSCNSRDRTFASQFGECSTHTLLKTAHRASNTWIFLQFCFFFLSCFFPSENGRVEIGCAQCMVTWLYTISVCSPHTHTQYIYSFCAVAYISIKSKLWRARVCSSGYRAETRRAINQRYERY